MLRVSRDLRGKQQQVDDADALLVMACGAGISQSLLQFRKDRCRP